ncbi:MAG: sulfur oxidation c-type cytochrome SoxX [Pseudomonadota bacterium]
MITSTRVTGIAAAAAIAVGATLSMSTAVAADDKVLEEGKKLSFSRKDGNCLACHVIEGGEAAGNIGPPLMQMKLRFPDKAVLRAQIADASVRNAETSMPLFGKYGILSDSDLDKVVEYIHSL